MTQIYQNKAKTSFFSLLLLFTSLFCSSVNAQTLSTAGGTNYGALSQVAGVPGAVSFVVENATTQGRILSKIDCAVLAAQTNNTYTLWYSATSLSGQPTVAEPAWTLIATGDPISEAADGIVTVLDNINFAIPGNTQYRFVLATDNGIRYTGTTGGTPNPNTFTSGGFTLKVGNAQISGANVGWGGAFTAITNTPRYFTGVVYISPCTSTTNASLPAITPDTVVCGEGSAATLRVINGNLNAAVNWKWYTGSCGTGTLIGTGTSVTVSPTVNTTYYVRGEGGCAAAPGNCASVVVTVRTKPGNPIIDPVAPICLGDLSHLQINPITLGTTPIPDSVTVTSAFMSLAVPDETEDGVNTALTIPALPFGSQMTGIDVTMSLSHTYPGDMIINLQAPNGAIANLYKYNTGTFTGNNGNLPNTGWFNAVTSSAGNTVYSTIPTPYRYNAGPLFIPDLINDNVDGPNVQNPTGFSSTAAVMPELYSTPAGAWTLALADGGPGDLGTLTRWSIKIKYNRFAQIPATPGIWTPGNGTLFTDAAGTIAYDGTTPRLDIYAMPTTTAVYAATSSINGCNSEAVNTTVTVNIPAAVTTDIPSAASVCELGTTAFSITASGTNPAYQWQTDNGTGTFVNIMDGDNYTGAATNTLTVKNAPKTWDGYKYFCVLSSTAPCSQSVNSGTVTLTVNPTPTVSLGTANNAPTHLLPGMVTSLTVASSPAGDIYTWFKNGDTLFNATGSSYDVTIDNQGIYKVSVVDVNGCTNTTNTLEIADSVSNRLFIYPNPSQNGQFSVSYYSLKNNILPRVLTIYDSKGALVLKQSYTLFKPYDRMTVDFGRLSKGVYLVNLLDRSGKRLATGKVVVE